MEKGEESRLRSVGQCIPQSERAFSSEFGDEPVRQRLDRLIVVVVTTDWRRLPCHGDSRAIGHVCVGTVRTVILAFSEGFIFRTDIGTRIAFTSGPEYQNHNRIWAVLDKVLAKYPDMVLFHGGNPTGGEHIASVWARNRKITHVAFRPDWTRYKKAAPFRRNDQMLEAIPKAVVACPGNGINANLVDKARKLGISVWTIE